MSNPASPESAGSSLVIGVLASGRGSNLQSIIDAIDQEKLDAEVGVVISNKKEAPALDRARRRQIPAFFIDPGIYPDRSGYEGALVEVLKRHRVGIVVLAGYMRLLGKQMVEAYRNRIINIHPSLLPSFPGLHAARQALEYGVKISGCTVHFVDEEVDHGPIIGQAGVPVFEGDTEEDLSQRILAEEHRLLPEVLQILSEGRLTLEGRKVTIQEKTGSSGARPGRTTR